MLYILYLKYNKSRYSEDDCWYRAIVIDIDGDNVTIQFVDYGNTDVSPRGVLKALKSVNAALALQAIHCTLGDAPVGGWLENDTTQLVELSNGGEEGFECRFLTRGVEPYTVHLTNVGGFNVKDVITLFRDTQIQNNATSDSFRDPLTLYGSDDSLNELEVDDGCAEDFVEPLNNQPTVSGVEENAIVDVRSVTMDPVRSANGLAVRLMHSISPTDFFIQVRFIACHVIAHYHPLPISYSFT